jgi:hypothetical protein
VPSCTSVVTNSESTRGEVSMGSDPQTQPVEEFKLPEGYAAWCRLCNVGFTTLGESQQHDRDNLNKHREINAGSVRFQKQTKPLQGVDYIGKLLVGKTAQGTVKFVGVCVSYTDRPTIKVRCPDGSEESWILDLCEIVEISKEALDKLFPMK